MEYCSITTNMPTVLFMNLTISEVLTAASVIVMVIATIFAYNAAKATMDNTKTLLFQDILKEYSSDQMREDLMSLQEWKNNNKSQLEVKVKAFGGDRKNLKDEKIQKVDKARRRVKHYFTNVLSVHKEVKLPDNLLEFIFNLEGIKVLFEIVEPLERSVSDKLKETEDVSQNSNYRPPFDEIIEYVKDPDIKRVVDEMYK